MNRLRNTKCYLCGPMDRAPDGGSGWRESIKSVLGPLGIVWLDPCDKPTEYAKETPETRLAISRAKESGDWHYVSEKMKWIRRVDLRMVHVSDFLVVHCDINIHSCGSYEEMTWANQQKKPILFHCEQGKSRTPSWVFGWIPQHNIFNGWHELYNYIRYIDQGNIQDLHEWSDNRWHLFNWHGDACG